MANRSSNTTAVPEAKSALDRFKMEVAGRRIQRKPDFPSEWFCRRLYGQKDDRSTGTADVRTEQHGQPERHERLPDVSLAGKTGKKTGAGDFSPAPVFFRMITVLHFRLRRRLQHSKLCFLRVSDKR